MFVRQFIFSALLGWIAFAVYLGVSYYLDSYISTGMANLLGLVANGIVNFYLQSKLFLGENGSGNYQIRYRFLVSTLLGIVFAQALFELMRCWVLKNRPDYYAQHWNEHVTRYRVIASAITYVLITFPTRKYYSFYIC